MSVPAGQPPLLRSLPGSRTSFVLLTVLTILLAWPGPPPLLAALVRPCYFALLAGFFWHTASDSPELDGMPMRLVRGGFVILFVAFAAAATIQLTNLDGGHPFFVYLREACERGAFFLLGTTLLSYGLMLWIPAVIESHRLLAEHSRQQRGALRDAETARSDLEQRLVEADRRGMLGELAATIAHDLRNPLTIVKGTAESLCRRPRSLQEVAEHTDVIRRNIDKADQTIESLIGLAKPRKGTAEATTGAALLGEVMELLRVEVRRRNVELRLVPTATTVELATDKTLASQALLNLMLNAVQATAAGGRVAVRARLVQFRGCRRITFAIEDRGVGLPPAVRAGLSTPFFTTKAGGTGLGLASCRRIATELGGRLRLYPRTGGGTRALLQLPVTMDPDSRRAASAADAMRQWATIDC
ncbi:MAG: HAMP domain-containing histidine kinase [Planctomycetes bacterium]|nr:HAMP domain-containing histidine kinase [Planctomycetota bacterium]